VKFASVVISLCCCVSVLLFSTGRSYGQSPAPRFVPHAGASGKRQPAPARSSTDAVPPGPNAPYPDNDRKLNEYQRDRLEKYLSGAAVADDTLSIIAIQVQFADSLMGGQGTGSREELHDSTYFAGELAHVEQYFAGASRNHQTIRWEVASAIYNLPEKMGYYGNDGLQDVRAVEMMASVIDSADADIDFSLYDTVMLIHAGAGQETDVADDSRVQLWSSFYSRGDIDEAFPDSSVSGLPTDDQLGGEPFLVDNFILVPEASSQDDLTIGSLGVWAFEVASRIGLLPLFDSTPDGFPDSRGAASYDLMASGLFNGHVTPDLTLWPGFVPGFPSVFNRVLAGWIDPLVVVDEGSYSLRDINSPAPGDTSCLKIPITESEYYLLVNRVHDANFDSLFTFDDADSNFFPDNSESLSGAEFDFFLTVLTDPFLVRRDPAWGGVRRIYFDTGSGMYIWHIDENVIRQLAATGHLPDDFVSRKGVDLEEADGVQDLDGLGDPFSFGSHFDSFRASNNATFGPLSDPSTVSNSGAPTGIVVGNISAPGPVMTCTIGFDPPFEEKRARWAEASRYQCPSLVDIDGNAGLEIVLLGDTANVYAFGADALELVDPDGRPETIGPYIVAPGARWLGPPAFGDIDGDPGAEIVACDEGGGVYAWNGDGSEVFDGDGDPATTGVLYMGDPIAAPPLLADVNGDGTLEIVFVERRPDILISRFIDGEGRLNQPSGADFVVVWGRPVQAQACSPLAFGALGGPGADTEGVAFCWADSIAGSMGFEYLPLRSRGSPAPLTPHRRVWAPDGGFSTSFPASSSIAVGDLDGNGFDEAVFTIEGSRLVRFDWKGATPDDDAHPMMFIDLLSSHPSAPALGDVDGNGTVEIALWDDGFFYVFEHTGELRTNWPQPLRPTALGDFPELRFDERLVSPLVADVDGDGRAEILFPKGDGTIHGFGSDGDRRALFPRAVPDGLLATPAIGDLTLGGGLDLVSFGRFDPLVTVESVADSLVAAQAVALSVQSLPDATPSGSRDWPAYQRDLTRQGRWSRTAPPSQASRAIEPGSFKVYPNPVRGKHVHARVILNEESRVRIDVFTLEGERAATRSLTLNAGDVIHTPLDETVDVGHLKSGIYVLRLEVGTENGTESFIARFAILR
jgi:M6 family metalloprotease-like protein